MTGFNLTENVAQDPQHQDPQQRRYQMILKQGQQRHLAEQRLTSGVVAMPPPASCHLNERCGIASSRELRLDLQT